MITFNNFVMASNSFLNSTPNYSTNILGLAPFSSTSCNARDMLQISSLVKLCDETTIAACNSVPKDQRRSCNDRDDSIVHKDMTATEIYNFSKGCLKAAATSFKEFFTVFIPEVCVAIWNLSKETASVVANGEVIKTLKGATETGASLLSDVYKSIIKSPGEFFNNIWDKIVAAISPLIDNYNCHSPQAKVEKICGIATQFIMPPALLAKVIVKGPAFAKAYLQAKKIPEVEIPKVKDIKGSPELNNYKILYRQDIKLPNGSNANFMEKMQLDKARLNPNVLYFEVENAVLKTLNDTVIKDKAGVDAINNSYMQKLHKNLMSNPNIAKKMSGQYKDYKSYRLRLNLKSPQEKKEFETILNSIYKKTNDEFLKDLSDNKISQLIPPSTGNVGNPARWFLSGTGASSNQANMAARAARERSDTGKTVSFGSTTANFAESFSTINKLSKALNVSLLSSAKIVEKSASGATILSKPMIQILRKTLPGDFKNKEEYLAAINKKITTVFGVKVPTKTTQDLALYFEKVDGLSPPLYIASREIIDLSKARHGIVSVDFAGIGVDNIHAQMSAIAGSTKTQAQNFAQLESSIDRVTLEMQKAKREFDRVGQRVNSETTKTQFSGDDGILMPSGKKFSKENKIKLVDELAKSSDPSKFRVTFVDTLLPNGKELAAFERSQRIVAAENIEKRTREAFTGPGKIPAHLGKRIITAVDYKPNISGGRVTLIVSGNNLTMAEKLTIGNAFKKSLLTPTGEIFDGIIFN